MQIYEILVDDRRREKTIHGSYDFPLAVYENVIHKNVLGYINWHWHEEFQFSYVTEGVVEVFLNQRKVTLKKGEGIFLNSGVLHMARAVTGTEGAYHSVDFSQRLIASFPGSVFETSYIAPILQNPALDALVLKPEIPWQKKILQKLQDIYRIDGEKERGYELELNSLLLQIWHLLLCNVAEERELHGGDGSASAIDPRHRQRLRDIIDYIQKHYSEKISLEDIAACVYLSTSECCRFFKRNMNCTLFQYLIDYRLEQSMKLLRFTDRSVGQIAYDTGFSSSSYYIEKFREKTGQTPRAWRAHL